MDTSKIFKNHLILLRMIEIVPLSKTRWSAFYILIACVIRIMGFFMLASFCMQVMKSRSLQEFCETFFLASTLFKCVMSGLYIQNKHEDIRELQKMLKTLDGYISGDDEIKILKKCFKSAQYWFIFFVSNLLFILIICEIIVMTSNEPVLPLKLWFPWDWQQGGLGFSVAHFTMTFSAFFTCFLEILADTFPQASLTILCGHLRALSLRIKKIRVPAAQEEHLAYKELLDCIKAYQFIMKAFVIVKQIVIVPSGLAFGNSAVAQCSLATYMVFVGMQSDMIILLFVMFVALAFMSFVLCAYGELLQQESANFSHAVYACDWPSQNVQFKRTLIHLLLQSQRTFQIKAANLFPLNIKTFYEILKINYSIFAVLNQFK